MNIDPKLAQFKSFLSENKLNNGGVKTTIDQSAVSAGENANVDLDLKGEAESQKDKSKSKNNKKNKNDLLANKNLTDKKLPVQNANEVKAINMKLLNLI